MGAILNRAFDDCIISESIFKLLHIFGTLSDRPIISKELDDKMPKLIVLIDAELDATLTTFEKQESRLANKGKPLIDKNMPAIAGQLALSHELKHGMSTIIKGFTELTHPIINTKEAADIVNKFRVLMKHIDDYEENVETVNRGKIKILIVKIKRVQINGDVRHIFMVQDVSNILLN